jgi:addiction module HigA family antidote
MTRITTHPGEVLGEEFMAPYGMSASALARAFDVPANRITEIVAKVKPCAVTPDTALRPARYFDTTPQFWLNLQLSHDLSQAVLQHGEHINAVVQPKAA